MLVTRWQAPMVPGLQQIIKMYEAEGLVPNLEVFEKDSEVLKKKRHFDAVITLVKGEIIFDVNGNKLMLRAGDRITIPSNTNYSFKANHDVAEIIVADKVS